MTDLRLVRLPEVPNAVEYQPQNLLPNQIQYWDVVFTFPNLPDRIEAHELYLKARSPVFKQMFRKRKSGNPRVKTIEINESSPQRFQQFLELVYNRKFEVNAAEALDLLDMAQRYQVKPLIRKCEERLRGEIKRENSVQTFETARRYGNDELVHRAGGIMANSLAYLIENEALANAEEESLIYLLKRDDLYVKEVEIFELILKWGKNRVSASDGEQILRDKLKNLIPLIRYTNMSTYEFTSVVLPAKLLSPEDIVSIYSYAAGDEAMRNNMYIKFNIIPRNKTAFVDFFAGSRCQSERRERISANLLKLCISFQVQPLKKMSANGGLKKPAITAIKVKWPFRSVLNSKSLNNPSVYAVFVKECTGPVRDQNVRVRFERALRNIVVGKEDQIPVKPAVKLIPGVTYFIIVEDQSKPDRDTANHAVEYVYSEKFNPYDIRQKASVDLGCVDLQLTEIQKENRLSGFTHSPGYFAANVIRGIKLDQV